MDSSDPLTADTALVPHRLDLRAAIAVQPAVPSGRDTVEIDIEFYDQPPCRLVVPISDVERFTSLLLLIARATSSMADIEAVEAATAAPTLLPADSVSVGEMPGGSALLAIQVGPATLAFSLPPETAVKTGRSLLLLGATDLPAS